MKPGTKVALGIISASLLAALLVVVLSGRKSEGRRRAPGVSAAQLYRAYDGNSMSASQRYQGHEISVSGTVLRVRRVGSSGIVTLAGPNEYIEGVECHFDQKYNSQIASLKPGDALSLSGIVTGFDLWVIMDNCRPD